MLFWLPMIVTRVVDKRHYQDIENYLCHRLQIQEPVLIDGEPTTRKMYLASVDKWKHEKNIELMKIYGIKRPRYRRHELMDAIEALANPSGPS